VPAWVGMRIQESKLEQFMRLGGYEIVRQVKQGKFKGHWRNLSKAQRKTGISRPTIYKILEKYPEKPSRIKPKYLERLEESEGYKRFMQLYGVKLNRNDLQQNVRYMQIAFKMLGRKTPESWTEQDYEKLWYNKEFYRQECKGIDKRVGVYFRRVMRATDRFDLLQKFKYKAPPEGKRKQWFLNENEIKALAQVIEEKETLMLLFVGISVGARHQALNELRVKDVDFNDKVLQVYESKTCDYVLKFPPYVVFELLKTYVTDLNLCPEDKLFPSRYGCHSRKLMEAGWKAKLKRRVTPHILKHTYVTQANRHGVSAETIVHQTGTELRCLEKFYRATNESRLRNEMQGTAYEAIPFHEWIRKLSLHFKARYGELKK
jgi:integrase